MYHLSREITVDEAMIPFKGRLGYKQYIKDFTIYAGKDEGAEPTEVLLNKSCDSSHETTGINISKRTTFTPVHTYTKSY
jgi:hypothetical protein